MLYKDKDLTEGEGDKPFIYTNFVSTVDGKVQVLENWKSYWPIGSRKDYEVLVELRSLADVTIHGSSNAKTYRFVKTIQTPLLKELREKRGVNEALPYIVLSNHPDISLVENLKNPDGAKAYLATSKKAVVPEETEKFVNLIRVGEERIDLKELVTKLASDLNAKRILVEGGPNLLGSFFTENLIDEVFLTVTPKIFGNQPGKTLTLVEGVLFPADKVRHLKLASVKQIEDELFLRYKVEK